MLQHYWNLTIRLFSVIFRTFVEGVLPFCLGAVGVFYSPSRLGHITPDQSKPGSNCIEGCLTLPQTLVLESCHQVKFSFILRTPLFWDGSHFSPGYTIGVFYTSPTRLRWSIILYSYWLSCYLWPGGPYMRACVPTEAKEWLIFEESLIKRNCVKVRNTGAVGKKEKWKRKREGTIKKGIRSIIDNTLAYCT